MNELTERECFELLGLTPPEEEGVNEQEVADPAEDTPEEDSGEAVETAVQQPPAATEEDAADEDEGANEQEAAAPAEEETEQETPAQTREERARQAAARRERERQAAVDEAVRAERERTEGEIKEIFQWAGFKDGTAPIESLDQMKEYIQRVEANRLEQELKEGKLTPDRLRQMVQNELRAQQPTSVPPAADTQAFQEQVNAELEEIRKYDPTIQTVNDFMNLDRRDAFFAEVRDHGHTFAEAYKYVYADKIAAAQADKAAAASARRTQNSIRSKDHLRPAQSRGAGNADVPRDVLDNYRALGVKMSGDEIAKHYNSFVKRTK